MSDIAERIAARIVVDAKPTRSMCGFGIIDTDVGKYFSALSPKSVQRCTNLRDELRRKIAKIVDEELANRTNEVTA